MTGHSAPTATRMLAFGNYRAFCLLYAQRKLSGSACPGSTIMTANACTVSLGKPNKVQNLQVSSASPGTKCCHITHAVFMSL
jgi:hypothetical protein